MNIMQVIQKNELYIDLYGRVVFDHHDALKEVQETTGDAMMYDTLWNGACHNSRCG